MRSTVDGADRHNDPEAGYVLPLVILQISIVALALWASAAVLDGIARDLFHLRAQSRAEVAGFNAEAELTFLLLTEPLDARGLRMNGRRRSRSEDFGVRAPDEPFAAREREIEEAIVRFDGRPYSAQTGGGVVIRVQDEAGLFNLNNADEAALVRILRAVGKDETGARSMAGALADFIDPDDLKRLNGAEADQYRRAGMPVIPPNRTLDRSVQAMQALGWRQGLSRSQRLRLLAMVTTAGLDAPKNLNTAPPEVVQAWIAVSQTGARRLAAARETQIIDDQTDASALAGEPGQYEEFRVYGFPGRRFRLSVEAADRSDRARAVYETVVAFAEPNAGRPFFLDSPTVKHISPQQQVDAIQDDAVPRFPTSPRLSAARGRGSPGG